MSGKGVFFAKTLLLQIHIRKEGIFFFLPHFLCSKNIKTIRTFGSKEPREEDGPCSRSDRG